MIPAGRAIAQNHQADGMEQLLRLCRQLSRGYFYDFKRLCRQVSQGYLQISYSIQVILKTLMVSIALDQSHTARKQRHFYHNRHENSHVLTDETEYSCNNV